MKNAQNVVVAFLLMFSFGVLACGVFHKTPTQLPVIEKIENLPWTEEELLAIPWPDRYDFEPTRKHRLAYGREIMLRKWWGYQEKEFLISEKLMDEIQNASFGHMPVRGPFPDGSPVKISVELGGEVYDLEYPPTAFTTITSELKGVEITIFFEGYQWKSPLVKVKLQTADGESHWLDGKLEKTGDGEYTVTSL